jgi:hypothetical protein
MARRHTHRLITAVGVCVLAAGAVTAAGAGASPAAHPPGPKAMWAKLHSGHHSLNGHIARVAAQDGGGGVDADEAESVKLRGEYEQSIVDAPAVQAPAAAQLAAYRAARSLPTVGGNWREVTNKPFVDDPLPRGDNYGVGWGDVTGRITALTHAGNTLYVASASGGVWRSTDHGASFSPVNKGLPRLAVGAIATDPRDGSVWAGTGEANNASENQFGVGVYRLARGSSRWQRIGGAELYGAGSYRIRWIRGYVYVATSHGLFRRAAGARPGVAWRPVLQPTGPKDYPPTSSVTDVVPVPHTHGRRILAAIGWAGYSNPPATGHNGFYVGTGRHGSFHKVTPTGEINPDEIGRTSFSSSHGWLYAVVEDTATDTLIGEGVFLSRSGKPTGPWQLIADTDKLAASGSALTDSSGDYFPGIQSDYNQYILADPNNRRHVYLGLEEVFETTNAGTSWLAVGNYWNYDVPCDTTDDQPYNCPYTTHPDQHADMLWNGQFYAGNDGGLWRRPASWHQRGQWTNLNATLHTTQNYSIAAGTVPSGVAYWGGLQDNGESYTRTHLYDVEQAFTGDGGDTIVDPTHGNRAVEEYVYLDMFLTTDGARTLREISPSCLTATDPPATCDPNPRFVAPIEMDVNDPTHWVAGGQYVWDDTKSWATVCNGTDGCDWQKVYDTGDGHSITALADNGATTYAGWCGSCNPPDFARGLATNYGGTWHELPLTGVPNRYITSLAVDPNDAAHVFLTLGSYSRRWIPDAGYGHVYESTDGGQTWHNVSGNLPDAPVYKLLMRGPKLVVGTEVGAFVSTRRVHGAARWNVLGHRLPNSTVWDLTTVSAGGGQQLVAGTHGRGDWQLSLP